MIPLLFATLVTLLLVGATLVVQMILVSRRDQDVGLRRRVVDLARERGGVVSPRGAAQALNIPVHEADRLLRHMVDEEHLRMELDTREGELVFVFPALTPGEASRSRAPSR